MMINRSLRRQLLQKLLWPFIAILLLGMGIAYYFAIHAATRASDLGLLDDAIDLIKQVEVHKGNLTLELPLAATQMLASNNDDREMYAAWDGNGKIFSGDARLVDLNKLSEDENHRFFDTIFNGEKHRVVVLHQSVNGIPLFIAVAQTMHGSERMSRDIFFSLLLPEILLAVASVCVILFGIKSGLQPVEILRNQITSRSSTDLSLIEEESAPIELRPIIHGVNELFGKLSTALASHRRFIADAAHQLRTPLASLGSQIEVNLAQPAIDSRATLLQLLATTNRTSHLANQLLSLARLEHTDLSSCETEVLELSEVIRDVAKDFVGSAARKNIDLSFELQPCQAMGNAILMGELLANLLDNAVRYVSLGGHIRVTLKRDAAHCLLSITDDGPGVPSTDLEKLGTPFYRHESNLSEGCGLGLAIVKEIVRLHGANIVFESADLSGGFRASLRI